MPCFTSKTQTNYDCLSRDKCERQGESANREAVVTAAASIPSNAAEQETVAIAAESSGAMRYTVAIDLARI